MDPTKRHTEAVMPPCKNTMREIIAQVEKALKGGEQLSAGLFTTSFLCTIIEKALFLNKRTLPCRKKAPCKQVCGLCDMCKARRKLYNDKKLNFLMGFVKERPYKTVFDSLWEIFILKWIFSQEFYGWWFLLFSQYEISRNRLVLFGSLVCNYKW